MVNLGSEEVDSMTGIMIGPSSICQGKITNLGEILITEVEAEVGDILITVQMYDTPELQAGSLTKAK